MTSTLKKAEAYCKENAYQFTEPRKKVLSILLDHDEPLGAYRILETLTTKSTKPKPPTIYRAIDFWLKHGFIHKVESVNGYIACKQCKSHTNIDLLVCDICKRVTEIHLKPLEDRIKNKKDLMGFKPNIISTEIHGTCKKCLAK